VISIAQGPGPTMHSTESGSQGRVGWSSVTLLFATMVSHEQTCAIPLVQ
jgi:hypothetical protein